MGVGALDKMSSGVYSPKALEKGGGFGYLCQYQYVLGQIPFWRPSFMQTAAPSVQKDYFELC